MRRSVIGIIFDLVILPAVWLCGRQRLVLLLILAIGNLLYYLFLLSAFLYRTGKQEERKGHALEFVLIQFFLCMGLFLFKLTDLLIIHNCR